MIIQCDKCSTKFRLDDSRITGHGIKVRCTKCQNVFIVTPPPPVEEVHIEEIFGVTSNAPPPPEPKEPKQEAQKKEAKTSDSENLNLKFDFSRPDGGQEEAEDETSKEEDGSSEKDAAMPPSDSASLGDMDFSFAEDRSKDEEVSKDGEAEYNEVPSKDEKTNLNDLDFSFDDVKPDEKQTPEEDDWGLGGSEAEKKEEEAEKPVKAAAPKAEEKLATAAYTSQGRPAPKAAEDLTPKDDDSFSDVLSSLSKENTELPGESLDFDDDEAEAAPKKAQRPSSKGLLIAIAVFVLGGAFIYFTGIIDKLAKSLMPPSQTQAQKTVEIETINGYFIENKNFGKLFVLDAKIKNVTDLPQAIKAVTGVLYNSKGEKIASRSVAPGRVVSQDDLKNLPKDDLLKPFKDPSGGMIPAKGIVPIMVLFTEVPEGINEYGLDIIR